MFPTLYDFGTITILGKPYPIGIHSYGIMMALAFLTALVGLQREFPRKNIDVQLAYSIVFRAVVFGILGAKIYYVIEFQDLSAFFSSSGLVLYGGLIAG
ncbi:TPA: hypothetical protein EYN98_09880, partial [Candidatus Poribacteria bacterium]|nr:hypothetical protein [Candidatus Poribacteria bacterium]